MIAVISDIHGNLEALEAVLEDAKTRSVSEIICLGDVVGYGADPNGCMDRVEEAARVTILGNHDAAARDAREEENFNDVARRAIQWTRDQLTPVNQQRLAKLEYEHTENGTRYVHASPDNPPAWHYILTEQEAWDAFGAFDEQICFVGHSHVPLRILFRGGSLLLSPDSELVLEDDVRALVNVGSVGQPRDGDWRASYALWEPEARRVTALRVEYDLERASRKILEAGLPDILARRLAVGQ